MKKITLNIVALIAFAINANAQTPDSKFGIKGGLNFSNITNDSDAKTRTSIHIGAIGEFFINEKFSIQPEIIYSAQGAKVNNFQVYVDNFGAVNADAVMKNDYINIPVMAKYYFSEGFNFQVGPQIGFLASSKMKVTALGQSTTVNMKEIITSTDFGLNFGVGYQLPEGLFFDARYNLGLTKINKDGSINGQEFKFDSSSENRVFQLSVGYKF